MHQPFDLIVLPETGFALLFLRVIFSALFWEYAFNSFSALSLLVEMKPLSKKKTALVGLGLVVFIAVVMLFYWVTYIVPEQTVKKTQTVQVQTAASKIELIELSVRDCNQCVSFELFKKQLHDLNKEFDFKKVYFDSNEGKELTKEYSIESVPTIIIKNASKSLFGNWDEVGSIEGDGSLVFRARIPVYWDLKQKRFAGLVNATELVDSSCASCFDPLQSNEMQLLLKNIKVKSVKRVEAGSVNGKKIVEKYHLGFVPALIFSREIRDYNFFSQFAPLGSIEADGSFVVRTKFPPYKDLDSNTVKGLLSVTVIEPTQCWACRDAKDLLSFLNSRLGLRFSNVSVIDANTASARTLSDQYSIQYAPAALITGNINLYPGMEDAFPKIGRVFKDGVHAFDNPLLLGQGYYYDFNSGEIVTVKPKTAQ